MSVAMVDAMVDGTATLEENVRSWTDRVHAENAACSAAGVREFDDRLAMTFSHHLTAVGRTLARVSTDERCRVTRAWRGNDALHPP